MAQFKDQWMFNPTNYRKMVQMRAEMRKETGSDIHFSDEESMLNLLELCLHSKNPRMKVMALEFRQKIEEQV